MGRVKNWFGTDLAYAKEIMELRKDLNHELKKVFFHDGTYAYYLGPVYQVKQLKHHPKVKRIENVDVTERIELN
jgi:hypothetical protein